MKVLASETICPFSSQWLSKAFKFVHKLGRELTFCGALEDTSARHAAGPKSPYHQVWAQRVSGGTFQPYI